MFDYQKSFGSPCITMTEQLFEELINCSVVVSAIDTVRYYQDKIDHLPTVRNDAEEKQYKEYEKMKQNAKKRLPGIMFQATFLPTQSKKGYNGKWRKNAAAVLNGLYILDVDHLSQDTIKEVIEKCKPFYDKEILLLFVTASGHGIKMVAKADPLRGNIEANQQWLAKQIGVDFDTACKDAARISFCPSAKDIIYLNKEIFTYNNEEFEVYYGCGYRDGSLSCSRRPNNNTPVSGSVDGHNCNDSQKPIRPIGIDRDQDRISDETCAKDVCTKVQTVNNQLPTEFGGVSYQCIVDKYVECQGKPETGGRHQWLLRMAKDMRYICDFRPTQLMEIMKLCATAREVIDERGENEVLKICEAACSYKFYSGYPKAMKEVFKVCGIDISKNDSKCPEKEEIAIDYDYWAKRLLPLLEEGDAYSDAVKGLPDRNKLGGVLAAGAMYGTYMSKTMFPFYDGKNYRFSYIVYIIGHAASGKSFIIDMDKEIMEGMKRQDEQYRQLEKEYKETKERMSTSSKDAKDKAPQRPHYPIRYVPSTISNAKLYARLQDATDLEDETMHLHLFTLESELATALRVQVGSWAGKLDLELKSFQNEYAGVDYANELSANGLIQVNWNQVISGTMDALRRKMRGGSITDGYITRMALWIMPNSEYTMIEKKYNSVEVDSPEEQARKQRIKGRVVQLEQLRCIFTGIRQLTDFCYDWCATQCRQAELEEDACIEYFRKRIPIYMMRYTMPRIICRQLEKFENGYLREGEKLEILPSDLQFAELIGDYLMFISIYQWGQQYLEFIQDEANTTMPRMRKSKFMENYASLPLDFTYDEIRKFYTTDASARRTISTLISCGCIEKIEKNKWHKLKTTLDDVRLR